MIDSSNSFQMLAAKEALHIIDQKPSLNIQLSEKSKYNINMLIIAAYPQCDVDEDDAP